MAQNILELWPCLSEQQRKTIEFAVQHCCGTARSAPLMTCEAVIDALGELNRKSDGHGREAHDLIEKLQRLDAKRSRTTRCIVDPAQTARPADPRGGDGGVRKELAAGVGKC